MHDTALTSTNFNQPRYWLWWVTATVGGWIIGKAAGLVIVAVFGWKAATDSDPMQAIGALLVLVTMGLAVGVLQWLVLRQHVPHSMLWIAATLIGLVAGTWFSVAYMGLGTGVAQWWIIRKAFSKSVWWPTVSAVAWPLGYMISGSVSGLMASTVPSALAILIGASVAGAVIGAVTGAVLLWMMREKRWEKPA